MIEAPPGRPVQNNPPQLERFHIYLLLVLGIAFVGAGLVVLGFAGNSPVAVGFGAGNAVVAAGFIAVLFALAGYRPIIEKKSAGTDADAIAALTPNAYPEHPRTAHGDDVPTKDEALHTAAKFAKLADLLRKPKPPT